MADSKRQAELELLIKEKGAKETAAEIAKLAKTSGSVQDELAKISRNDPLPKLSKEMEGLAKEADDAGKEVDELEKKFTKLGRARDAKGRFLPGGGSQGGSNGGDSSGGFDESDFGGGGSSGGGGGGLSFGQRVTRAGAQLRNLPSVRVPGTEIGTDAIGNITRLSGALLDVAGKSQLVTTATNLLTPALGAEAAATIGAAAPAAAFVVAFGVIAVALSSLTAATGQNAEAITAYAEAQRGLNADIVAGLTSKEAQKKLEDLNEARRLEEEFLVKNKTAYEAFEKQATDAGTSVDDFGSTLAKIVFGANAVGDVAKAISVDEQAIADNISTSEKKIELLAAQENTLIDARDSGRLAANDAAEAEKELAQERSKAALSTADNVAKELQAQQKALNSTEEQNTKRLSSIEDEKAVIQAQIDSLSASGVASEDVTDKIASLTNQLGLLGKESEFISSTALEASRIADADKKAKKDAEDASKKAEQAQTQYTKAVESASGTFKNSVQDIGTRLSQTLQDNTTKLNRDLNTLDTKFTQDQYDLQLKANRSELEAYQDQLKDIEDIRRDAAKDEREALIDGDFKALYLSRLARDEALQEEQQADIEERQKRKQNQDYAIEDLKTAANRQRDARRLGYEQQNTDAQTSRDRELQQARTAQSRALAQASAALNAELGLRQAFWNATVKQAQNALGAINGAAGAKTSGANANSPFGSFQSQFKAVMQR